MQTHADRLAPNSLGMLNRAPIVDQIEIQSLMRALLKSKAMLNGGMNRDNKPRIGRVTSTDSAEIGLAISGYGSDCPSQVHFSFAHNGRDYFFATDVLTQESQSSLKVRSPIAVYQSDRRTQSRDAARRAIAQPISINAFHERRRPIVGRIVDRSLHGLGIELPKGDARRLPRDFEIILEAIDGEKNVAYAQVRHTRKAESEAGWIRLGLSISSVKSGQRLSIDHRDNILRRSLLTDAREQRTKNILSRVESKYSSIGSRQQSVVVDIKNRNGRNIRSIVDSYGPLEDAVLVVIPPSWGKTKETLVGLSETILATFSEAGENVTVVRFDGTERSGESYVSPEFREPGLEYGKFTFSGAVSDIQSVVEYLHADQNSQPRATVLVTFSLASIEGRRAVAENSGRWISGWISVVGLPELQGALRTMSGGIDYGYGLLKGMRFGFQELAGVLANMDATGKDAIDAGMGFLEDARIDMAKIDVPITWIHGKHDAWISLDTVQEILSREDSAKRQLIEIPTGHEIRESREALQTFQLIAEEVSEMSGLRRLSGRLPNLSTLAQKREQEELRLTRQPTNLKAFWRNYLVGTDSSAGMELLSAINPYQELMRLQISELSCRSGDHIADLGAGNGDFPILLSEVRKDLESVSVSVIDYVPEALRRCRDRIGKLVDPNIVGVQPILLNLDLGNDISIGIADMTCDGALASLLINYLANPRLMFRELYRILKPTKRVVVSSLKRDADISKLYVDAWTNMHFVPSSGKSDIKDVQQLDMRARAFLNHASRLLLLAERGVFHFFDKDQLIEMATDAGFIDARVSASFGSPPQALVISATRP